MTIENDGNLVEARRIACEAIGKLARARGALCDAQISLSDAGRDDARQDCEAALRETAGDNSWPEWTQAWAPS